MEGGELWRVGWILIRNRMQAVLDSGVKAGSESNAKEGLKNWRAAGLESSV
jgi:hypothetical protein